MNRTCQDFELAADALSAALAGPVRYLWGGWWVWIDEVRNACDEPDETIREGYLRLAWDTVADVKRLIKDANLN